MIDMTNQTKTIIVASVILCAAVVGVVLLTNRPTEQARTLVGSDQDGHGCIGSAGYSWSEEREQCVRTWEVPIMVEAETAVRELLSQRYGVPLERISVAVTKIDNDHVAGSIKFSFDSNAEGGMFLAYKKNGVWELVYEGNGSIDCRTMREQHGFSDLILSPQFCD